MITDIIIVMIVLGGLYILLKSGKLQELLGGNFQLPQLAQQQQQQQQLLPSRPQIQETEAPPEAPTSRARAPIERAPTPVGGGEIYPTAGKVCTNVTDGGLEDHNGPRIEPQITCGANFENAEVTGYFMIPDGSDTISLKMRGPKHSGIPDAQMCNNIHYIPFGGNTTKPFGKQFQHTAEYCDFGSPLFQLPNFMGKWIGVKAVEWNQGGGVHMETWIDFPEGSGWKKWAQFDDVGSSSGCQKAPVYLKSPCSVGPVSIGYRVDGSAGTKFKNLSAREIAPGGGRAAMSAYGRYDTILTRT